MDKSIFWMIQGLSIVPEIVYHTKCNFHSESIITTLQVDKTTLQFLKYFSTLIDVYFLHL